MYCVIIKNGFDSEKPTFIRESEEDAWNWLITLVKRELTEGNYPYTDISEINTEFVQDPFESYISKDALEARLVSSDKDVTEYFVVRLGIKPAAECVCSEKRPEDNILRTEYSERFDKIRKAI